VQVLTISSWLNFGSPAPPRRGSAARRKFLAHSVCVSLSAFSLSSVFDSARLCVPSSSKYYIRYFRSLCKKPCLFVCLSACLFVLSHWRSQLLGRSRRQSSRKIGTRSLGKSLLCTWSCRIALENQQNFRVRQQLNKFSALRELETFYYAPWSVGRGTPLPHFSTLSAFLGHFQRLNNPSGRRQCEILAWPVVCEPSVVSVSCCCRRTNSVRAALMGLRLNPVAGWTAVYGGYRDITWLGRGALCVPGWISQLLYLDCVVITTER